MRIRHPDLRIMDEICGRPQTVQKPPPGIGLSSDDVRRLEVLKNRGSGPPGSTLGGLRVVALGALRNTGWLDGSDLLLEAGGDRDADAYALDEDGRPDTATAAGDLASFLHALYGGRPIAIETWSGRAAVTIKSV